MRTNLPLALHIDEKRAPKFKNFPNSTEFSLSINTLLLLDNAESTLITSLTYF